MKKDLCCYFLKEIFNVFLIKGCDIFNIWYVEYNLSSLKYFILKCSFEIKMFKVIFKYIIWRKNCKIFY